MSETAIRTEMAARLAAVTLTDTTPLRVSKWFSDSVNPPCAVIGDDDPFIDYDQTQEGGASYNFRVLVYASRADEESAQAVIAALRDNSGTGSVPAALNGKYSNAYYATVHAAGPVQRYQVGTIEFLGCEFQVEVVAS